MTHPISAAIDQFDLPHISGTGSFRISVSRIDHRSPETRDVPVLIVLDADIEFALAAEIARLRGVAGMIPTAMVVGVGYGADYFEMAQKRTADLTPPLSEAGKATLGGLAHLTGTTSGGAEAMLDFLVGPLRDEIARRYPEASATNQILFGHSLGGLFAGYALLTRPGAFATFVSASPSLWWDEFVLFSLLPAFKEKVAALRVYPRVFVCTGAKEQEMPTKVPSILATSMTLEELQAKVAHTRIVDAAAEFAQALREAGLTDVAHVDFPDEDHGTVVAPAINRGLVLAVPTLD